MSMSTGQAWRMRQLEACHAEKMSAIERECFTLPWSEEQCRAAFGQKAFAAFGLLTGCVVCHDLTGKTLVTVLREHIKAKEHNVFSFWSMKGNICEKFIAEHLFICCDAV